MTCNVFGGMSSLTA